MFTSQSPKRLPSWLKRTVQGLLLLLALALSAFGLYAYKTLPSLNGDTSVKGLNAGVEIKRDASDVTHIYASNDADAWFALGYTHAQERGWQLDFNHRIMHGELSELLGEATLDADKTMRTLALVKAATAQWQTLPEDGKNALSAYASGINAFYVANAGLGAQALPVEFKVLGGKPRTWQPQDALAWTLVMALDLGGNWGAELARLSSLQKLTTQQLWQLMPPYPGQAPASAVDMAALYDSLKVFKTPEQQLAGREAAAVPQLLALDDLIYTEGKGSNNWVLHGKRTVSGKPLLANDPHLALSSPAIWYAAALHAPGLEVAGASLPGTPGIVLGRTQGAAWGFTNTGPDVQDLYLERINPQNPAQYEGLPDPKNPKVVNWLNFETQQHRIKVKGKPDVVYTARATRHGPVVSDAMAAKDQFIDTQRYAVALRWTALDADNHGAVAGLRANKAQTVAQLTEAFDSFVAPMQSIVMADTQGGAGFKTFGRIPLRHKDHDLKGLAPAPGWLPQYDWQGYLPNAQTPQDDGKAKGYVATANHRIHAADFPHFLGADWTVPYRQNRIEELIDSQDQHSLMTMHAIQKDVWSAPALAAAQLLKTAQSSHPQAAAVQAALQKFDGTMHTDSTSALVVSVWFDHLTRVLVEPKLGKEKFARLYGKRDYRAGVEGMLARDDAFWCGKAAAAGGKNCQTAINQAFTSTLEYLAKTQGADSSAWQWGRAHPAISSHKPFGNVPLLAKAFDVRSPSAGDGYTVNVGQFHVNKLDAPHANRHAASFRAVYDLSNLEHSSFIYQTGQSGNVFSSRYRDMAVNWSNADGHQMSQRLLQLQPKSFVHTFKLNPGN